MMGMGWMMLGILFFWLVLILVAVLLVKALFYAGPSGTKPPDPNALSPMDVLELRYSRGEITREQFLQMKKDLGK
jgi:putative membrane protein